MAKAQLCPICGGRGTVRTEDSEWSTAPPQTKPCYGCGGKGWVSVDD